MGYPVVLIHGMWCTGADWARVRELMAPRGYDCHAPSLPAHDSTPDQPLRVRAVSLREYGGFLQHYVERQGFAQAPILIGHSMGGLLALQLAAKIQPLALVLLTPASPSGINALRGSTIVAFGRWLLGGAFWRNAHKPSPERAALSVFNGIDAQRQAELYPRMVHESGRAAAEIAFWWLDFSGAAKVDIAALRCPVYVVSSGRDRLTPARVVRKLVALLPQATQRHYPERGHWVIDDQETEEMVHAICGWLRPLEQRALRARRATA